MKIKGGYVLFFVFVLFLTVFFIEWRSANVSLEFSDSYVIGDELVGNLILIFEKGDSVNKEMPILISLIKDEKVLVVNVLTIEEFVLLSGEKINVVEKDGGYFYEEEGVYGVELNELIDYTFDEVGEYELFFSVMEIDLNIVKEFTVEGY